MMNKLCFPKQLLLCLNENELLDLIENIELNIEGWTNNLSEFVSIETIKYQSIWNMKIKKIFKIIKENTTSKNIKLEETKYLSESAINILKFISDYSRSFKKCNIIISPKMWANLDSTNYINFYNKIPDISVNPFVGTIMNRINVFVDIYEEQNNSLLLCGIDKNGEKCRVNFIIEKLFRLTNDKKFDIM